MDNTNKLNDEYLEKLKNGETIVIPLHEERIRVRKEKRKVEEIVIRREKYIEMEKVLVEVKKEVISVDQSKLRYDDIDK